MSTLINNKRITSVRLKAMKGKGSIVSLTAYTTPMAEMMDEFVDLIIVGDSTGMVAYGMNSTISVSVDMMINHGKAVTRGTKKACVIIDMPFASYQESPAMAYKNAARIMSETEAQGVKLEGGIEMIDTVKFLVERGIPVMPHIGMLPQHANIYGGFKVQVKTNKEIEQLVELSKLYEQAGAFSILIEGTYESAAREVTGNVSIPTIGIGASPECDGQVLVTEDLLGIFSAYTPKFAKKYVDLSAHIRTAFKEYERDVRSGAFPGIEHCFGINNS